MIERGYLPLKADRFAPFSATITFDGINLIGKTFTAQVRKSVNSSVLLVDLDQRDNPLLNGLKIISQTSTSTQLAIFIDDATIRAMPTVAGLSADEAAEPTDLQFAWDLQIVDSNGIAEVALYGPFVLRSGVTQ